jgi:hypothetical protein
MEKRTWARLIIAGLVIAAFAIGLYLCWSPIGRSPDPLESWGRGNPTISERNFYIGRIGQIIDHWFQTARKMDSDVDGRIKDIYRNLLVIDMDKQAIWIEDNGQMLKPYNTEFPVGLEWTCYHSTPKRNTELTGQIVLRFRGFHTGRLSPEFFCLVGQSPNSGHISFQFNGRTKVSDYGAGQFSLKSYRFDSIGDSENLYGSLIVTDDEYQRYRNYVANPNILRSDKESKQSNGLLELEANKSDWNRIEKYLYTEIDKQVRKAGYELRNLSVEPGPDYSAGYAEVRGYNQGFLRGILGRPSSVEAYLKIDYLGNDIWYAKSAVNPLRPIPARQRLDCEFLICPQGDVPTPTRKELIEKGRQKQQQDGSVPESKWKAVLSNGATVEFIGICENPSAGKTWWGPDGSGLNYVPYINTEAYGRPREDRKIYEFAWRTTSPRGNQAVTYSLEGSTGSYYRQIHDRYGDRIIEGLSANGYGFDKSQQKTTFKLGLAAKDWQTALTIKDEAGEIKFLDKQRIILNPPKIENGQIVVCCDEQYHEQVQDYQTEFALVIREGPATKTVSLERYEKDVTENRETGLREHKFIIEKPDAYQIEGVCFRYRPYEFVRFKNITLIPGKNQGFEILPGKQ